MLIRKDEIGIFEEVIEEAGEFAHDGGEGDLFEFSGLEEAMIEVFEVAVVDDGGQSGHVESRTWDGAAAGDMTGSVDLTAVGIEGSQAEEMSGLRPVDGA